MTVTMVNNCKHLDNCNDEGEICFQSHPPPIHVFGASPNFESSTSKHSVMQTPPQGAFYLEAKESQAQLDTDPQTADREVFNMNTLKREMNEIFEPETSFYASYENRLKSFDNPAWHEVNPHQWPFVPEQFAESGMFYTGRENICRCYACGAEFIHTFPPTMSILRLGVVVRGYAGGVIEATTHNVDPPTVLFMEAHQMDNPHCPLIMTSPPKRTRRQRQDELLEDVSLADPSMATVEARFKSFENWPRLEVLPNFLVYAGFFYTGQEDVCRCFCCGAAHSDWTDITNPLRVHALLSQTCAFLRSKASPQLFNEVEIPEVVRRQSDIEEFRSDEITNFTNVPWWIEKYLNGDGVKFVASLLGYTDINVIQNIVLLICLKENQVPTSTLELFEKVEAMLDTEDAQDVKSKFERTVAAETAGPNMCKKCGVNPARIVFLSCGHLLVCESCTKLLITCPACRTPIRSILKVFVS